MIISILLTEIHILSRVSWCNALQNVESILSWFQKRNMENVYYLQCVLEIRILSQKCCLCQNVPNIFCVRCVGRPRTHFGPVSSSSWSHMAISRVLLLVNKVKPCWPGLLLGWVTFYEISVVGFFSGRLFSFYSCTLRHQCDAGITKPCSQLISHSFSL